MYLIIIKILVFLQLSFFDAQGCNKVLKRLREYRRRNDTVPSKPTIQPCAGPGVDFCEDAVGYPEDTIFKVLEGTKRGLVRMMFTPDNHGSRMSLGMLAELMPNPVQLCPTTSTWIAPRLAKNIHGDWRYIVNRPRNMSEYTQFVHVTTCRGGGMAQERGTCDPTGAIINSNIKSRCEQSYMNMKLVVLGEDGTTAEIDTFNFPSCCNCVITENLEL